ncbi:MAG TPA: HAMP domain-containing sensor histidine kinase, partial [Acidimicrobiales bacterium]|nr:HAMP domain-containing sensor histidine kinase [Acidimicrobiales bacterium]
SGPLPGTGFGASITYQVITANGSVLGGNTQPPISVPRADQQVASGSRDQALYTVGRAGSSDHARVLTIPARPSGLAVQLVRPLGDIDHTLRHLELLLLLVTACGVGLALVLGYFVSRTSLRPIKRLTAAAEEVAATQHLDQQIEVVGDDELARLASSFNAMLAALAASRRQQTQLVADAGHELRTPLTSLRTNVEVLMKVRDLPQADRQSLLSDVQAQLEELTTLVGDLVELAREDELEVEPQDVHLDVIVERAIERARRRAPAVTFDANLEPGVIRGQPALLERAVLNVLDNAAKWSPPGSHVAIGLNRNGSGWGLSVKDHGPGIATEDLPHVFDRFYRAANARALPGSGLGLAIVRQVVEAHGGTVDASSPPDGGTLVQLSLPAMNGAREETQEPVLTPYPLMD